MMRSLAALAAVVFMVGLFCASASADDIFPPHLLSPLSLKLREPLAVESATVDGLDCTVARQEDAAHVVVFYPGDMALERSDRLQNLGAYDGMGLYEFELLICEPARLVEDLFVHSYLSNIVEKPNLTYRPHFSTA